MYINTVGHIARLHQVARKQVFFGLFHLNSLNTRIELWQRSLTELGDFLKVKIPVPFLWYPKRFLERS